MSLLSNFFNQYNQMVRGTIDVIGGKPYLIIRIGDMLFLTYSKIDYDMGSIETIAYTRWVHHADDDKIMIHGKSQTRLHTNPIVASFQLCIAKEISE